MYQNNNKLCFAAAVPAGRENDAGAFIDDIFSIDDSLVLAKGLVQPARNKIPYLALAPPAAKDAASSAEQSVVNKPGGKVHHSKVRPTDVLAANLTDLVSAMVYMFSVELPTHKVITGDQLVALKRFLRAITTLIPFPPDVLQALQKLSTKLHSEPSTRPADMKDTLREAGFDVDQLPTTWVGCRGSVPGRRGYPCSLWQLFHTMTVFALEHESKNLQIHKNALDANAGVLTAIFGYIGNFFSCQECRENFMRDADDLTTQTASLRNRDAVLWLWRMHNGVNRRLAGDITEDEGNPKVQFPGVDRCPQCRLRGSSTADVVRWQDDAVVEFLRGFYGLKPEMAGFNVRDPAHRQRAMELGFGDGNGGVAGHDEISGAVSSAAHSTVKWWYIAGVAFVAGALAGGRQFQRWRARPIKWSFNYSKARVKWM